MLYNGEIDNANEIAAALRRIARGFDELAAAIGADGSEAGEPAAFAVLREWGVRGLTRQEASALFRKYGLAPQTAGGWARGDWIERREDARSYLTERSLQWLAEQEEGDGTD